MGMAVETHRWSIEDLERLPDDGNKYEVVRGELFVTPGPSVSHELVLVRLDALLWPYVAANRLGAVFHPRTVVRFEDSEVEPDLTVRHLPAGEVAWQEVPVPILVVEVSSRATIRRDRNQKRQLYIDAAVAEYWIVDRDRCAVTVVRPGLPDREVTDVLEWHPPGASAPLRIQVRELLA